MKPFMLFMLASGMIFAGSAGRAAEKDDLKLLQGSCWSSVWKATARASPKTRSRTSG